MALIGIASDDGLFNGGDAGAHTILAAQAFEHDADLVFEKCRRVARRMFFPTCVAGSFAGTDFVS